MLTIETLKCLLREIDILEKYFSEEKAAIAKLHDLYCRTDTLVSDPYISRPAFDRILYGYNDINNRIIYIKDFTQHIFDRAYHDGCIHDISIGSEALDLLNESIECLSQLKSTFNVLNEYINEAFNEFQLSDTSGNLPNVSGMLCFQKMFCKTCSDEFILFEKSSYIFYEFKNRMNALVKSVICVTPPVLLDF